MGQRFVLRGTRLTRRPSSVDVDDPVVFDYRQFKRPVAVDLDNIAGVVRLTETEEIDTSMFQRAPRPLPLVSNQLVEPNLCIAFRSLVRVPRFKFGSDQVLPISGKERRRGAGFDTFVVTADDPDGLCDALTERGVRRYESIADVLASAIGLASGSERVARRREDERTARGARRKQLLWGIFAIAALLVRFLVPEDGPGPSLAAVVTISASTAFFTVLVAFVVSRIRPDAPRRRPVKDRVRGRDQLLVVVSSLAGIGVLIGAIALASLVNNDLVRRVLWGAVFGGFGGGAFIGPLFIKPRRAARQRASATH